MHRVIKLLVIFSAVASIFVWLNVKNKHNNYLVSVTEQKREAAEIQVAEPNNLEFLTDSMGDLLQKAERGQLVGTQDLYPVGSFWSDLVPILFRENFAYRSASLGGDLQSQLIRLFPNYTTSETEHIYQFLFRRSDRESSYKKLAKSLCFERLERVGCQLNFAQGEKLPNFAVCPFTKQLYKFDINSKKLSCFNDHLAFTYPQRKILGQPEEIYRQLAMGYYNSERLHRLDRVILGRGQAAVKEGETVADIGCGAGCYTWSLAHGVGHNGLVYAQDIDKSVLEFIDFVKEKRRCTNVQVCLANRDDPKLPQGSLDRLYLIDALNVMVGIDFQVYGEASAQAKQYLRRLIACLRPDGKIVVIDFLPYKNRPHLSKMQVSTLLAELGLEKIGDEMATTEPSSMYALTFRHSTK